MQYLPQIDHCDLGLWPEEDQTEYLRSSPKNAPGRCANTAEGLQNSHVVTKTTKGVLTMTIPANGPEPVVDDVQTPASLPAWTAAATISRDTFIDGTHVTYATRNVGGAVWIAGEFIGHTVIERIEFGDSPRGGYTREQAIAFAFDVLSAAAILAGDE